MGPVSQAGAAAPLYGRSSSTESSTKSWHLSTRSSRRGPVGIRLSPCCSLKSSVVGRPGASADVFDLHERSAPGQVTQHGVDHTLVDDGDGGGQGHTGTESVGTGAGKAGESPPKSLPSAGAGRHEHLMYRPDTSVTQEGWNPLWPHVARSP